jgi:hypothetical protein
MSEMNNLISSSKQSGFGDSEIFPIMQDFPITYLLENDESKK